RERERESGSVTENRVSECSSLECVKHKTMSEIIGHNSRPRRRDMTQEILLRFSAELLKSFDHLSVNIELQTPHQSARSLGQRFQNKDNETATLKVTYAKQEIINRRKQI